MKRHNKERGQHVAEAPEIFKDLWGFSFVEEMSFSKIKNEMWPKIRIVIPCAEDENKVKMIRGLLQKYEFPFSNLKIVSSDNKKESGTCKEDQKPIPKNEGTGNKPKFTFKVSGRGKLPPFKAS